MVKSDVKRLIAAILLSAMSFALTFGWYIISKPKSKNDDLSTPIAFVDKTNEDVNRKSAIRSLWEPTIVGDALKVGDAIRTSSNGEIRIQFLNSDRYLELEPDSLIVLQQTEKEITLDLMEGSAFVNGPQTNTVTPNTTNLNLTLNTQNGKVDLSKSTAIISGSSQNKMDVKVIKGTAQFKKQGGKTENIDAGSTAGVGISGFRVNSDKVKVLLPDTSKPFLISAENPTPVTVKWEGFPADAQIILESGARRKNLFSTPIEKISRNELKVYWKPGVYYWKLKAIDPDSQSVLGESGILKTEVVAKFAPVPVAPEPNFVIYSRRASENVTLKWSTSGDYKEVNVELMNETTGNLILSKKFPITQDSTDLQNLPLSFYKWRLTAFTTNGMTLTGNYHRFSIQEKRIIKIPIVWSPQVPTLQQYVNSEPKLTLQWNTEALDRVKKWKLRYTNEGVDLNKIPAIEVRSLKFEKNLTQKGRYIAVVEAIDDDGDSIGISDVRTFTIDEMPLLKAPVFSTNASEFLAKGDGTLNLSWNDLSGAKSYTILVRDLTGNIVIENSSEANMYRLNNLMPGEYDIQLGALDSFGRRGELTTKRKLIVPSKSEVKAPKLKKIKIN